MLPPPLTEWLYSVGSGFDGGTGKVQEACVAIEPPKPIVHFLYRCDKVFHVQSVLKLYQQHQTYGLVYITGATYKIYTFYKCAGHIQSTLVRKKSAHLAKGHKKGGQSQARIGRLHDESHFNYITLTHDQVKKCFISGENVTIEGLIVAGNAQKKDQLEKRLDYRLKEIYLGSIRCESEEGIFEKCGKMVDEAQNVKENALLGTFMDEFHKMQEPSPIVYGPDHVKKALYYGKLKACILHQEAIETLKITPDRMKRIEEKCESTGCELHILRSHTDLSAAFVGMGGVGGVLWYAGATDA